MGEKFIVVIDDERSIIELIVTYLSDKGHRAKGFTDAGSFFKFLNRELPDLVILDLNMPGMGGFEVLKKIKERDRFSSVPVIFLTGIDEKKTKIDGLCQGADDYIVKPFDLDEMYARIKAVLRRQGLDPDEKKMSVGKTVEMDFLRYEVTVEGEKIDLTPAEFKLLECLSSRKGQVFSRNRLLDYLWGDEKMVVERTIDLHIKHLRDKLGKAGDMIKMVRGMGYKLEEDENA
ncbi:MAG: response regulator transcription factor [Candidatus Omnitrophota bacterium]